MSRRVRLIFIKILAQHAPTTPLEVSRLGNLKSFKHTLSCVSSLLRRLSNFKQIVYQFKSLLRFCVFSVDKLTRSGVSSQKRIFSLDKQFLEWLRIPSVPRCHRLVLSNDRQTCNVYCNIILELCLEMQYDYAMIPIYSFYIVSLSILISSLVLSILWLYPTHDAIAAVV